jgi:nitrous oxidase accessory protein NosD
MKSLTPISVIALTMLVALPRVALASNTWYVNGLNGSDSNDCKSAQSACETISQTISKATSGDSIVVAAATYTENLTISISLNVMGSSAATTIIDGGGKGIVVTISSGTVRLSNVTVRNGQSGIHNLGGTLTISNCTVSRNSFGGIFNGNASRLIINNSTVSGNTQWGNRFGGHGAGIENYFTGILTINQSTITGNAVSASLYCPAARRLMGATQLAAPTARVIC